ncbi:acetyl esterase/lipase [Microbacteriaceae bacterium SG_E_30_P1]|uniref:Acetyl esterase/lipase n=1 Tax=Antiquaquibacter oligotrophicus TaxID=2880260 RepID=A0ABT6KRV1_9MICO|nr:prolyl oligopeptidase family serine peptidase [Antiquaquibacter oligotrophicus]MDH6182213.1 acetyl esterase/lipase [Antiquaquibacter oligotrophicus]UDF12127.1 prolyl oligopeptidase family serine peptidase [Antiquaquibacter oligotrophicus]
MSGSILVFPGGSYAHHANHEGEPVAEWLRGLGWDARVVKYPVGTRHPGPLLAAQRELAVERAAGHEVVGVLGFSAGGHLAAHAAVSTPRPDFAVLGYPVIAMDQRTHRGSRDNLLGPRPSWWRKRALSIDRLVTAETPPMFIWSTGADAAVPPREHSYRLAASLARHGVPHDLHVFAEGRHGLGFAEGYPAEAWRPLCERWLQQFQP